MKSNYSEFRQDPVSGDWILIVPGRVQHAWQLTQPIKKKQSTPIRGCVFEDPIGLHASDTLLFRYAHREQEEWHPIVTKNRWDILVVENKYPAVRHTDGTLVETKEGSSSIIPGAGHHDLVITRDHKKDFSELTPDMAFHVLEAFRSRYLMLFADKNIAYVSIFHNWGSGAGATVAHPHYQMLAIPVVPPDVKRSLDGSTAYAHEHKECVHCEMIDWEIQKKTRVIVETKDAIAVAPFVSRNPFEVRVFPKKHNPYFENASDQELHAIAVVLQRALKKIKKNLNDTDYNFFVHTAPILNKKMYDHYHWHIEIFPKVSTRAGFEYGTGIEINVIDPDFAAHILKK